MTTDMQNIKWPGWETVKLIGRGSFGAVYEIQRDVFGDIEKAALKVISIPQNASDIEEMYSDGYDDESITSTFQSHLKNIVAEYSLMRKMSGSSNIVNCDDVRYVQHDNGIGWDIFIKMELLTPLTKALPATIPEDMVIKVATDMCAALVLCRKYDIVHRDIKPQNIFLSPNGDYKLGDFGIAKTVEKTTGGTKIGTYRYMAPEVFHFQPYGSAADIYSLGLVLYWMLNERRMPFLPLPPEKIRADMDVSARDRRLTGEALLPPAHGSEALKRIVLKACAYDPAQRYTAASDMLHDLTVGLSAEAVHQDDAQAEWDRILREQEEAERRRRALEQKEKQSEEQEEQAQHEIQLNEQPRTKIIFLTAGETHAVCLCADGTLKASGDNLGGKCDVETWHDVIHVACGATYTVGLRSDGKVRISGEFAEKIDLLRILQWKNIVSVAVSPLLIAGLTAKSTVQVVGLLRDRDQEKISMWRSITDLAVGNMHVVGLKSDSTLVAVGKNLYNQCGVGAWIDVASVAAGGYHTIACKKNGRVLATGNNEFGQCQTESWSDIVAVKAGSNFSMGLRSDGTVALAGGSPQFREAIQEWRDIASISADSYSAVGYKKDGTVCTAALTESCREAIDRLFAG